MPKLFDLVKVNIATTGTGTVTFGSVFSPEFFTPSEVGAVDGDTVRYVLIDGTNIELGVGTIGGSVTTMTRTVTRSRVGGVAGTSKLNLSGTAYLALTAAAADVMTAPATVQRFTSGSGTYTPTSADVRSIRVRLVGGGGGGANATAAASQTNVGSGGGGGGYVEHVMAAGSYSYAVGAGGASQTTGGDSTFNSSALVASGGVGTNFNTGPGTAASRASGSGAGGNASGGNIANVPGGAGEVAFRYSGTESIAARGGQSFMGAASGQTLGGNGPAGQQYGGGGGGSASLNTTAQTGGVGAAGVIIIEEYY